MNINTPSYQTIFLSLKFKFYVIRADIEIASIDDAMASDAW
jgi:hypothetical protein